MKLLCRTILLCLLITLPGNCLRADAPASQTTFRIGGAVSKPGAWDAARLRRDLTGDIRPVAYTLKGQHHTAHAVPLWALLQAAQPRINPQIKHHLLQFVVAVRGQDGYTADFTLGELSPDFGGRAVWVAWDEDGKPLTGDAGPVQILVPGDKKPARWVHALALLSVLDGAQTPPSGP
jgi:hypothetical protein